MSFSIDNANLMKQVFDLLQNHFGSDIEFVFHDNTLAYEHTIVDIRNGHITGRSVGDTGDILGLEALGGNGGNSYNLINETQDNRILRSSTQFIKDNSGKICACVAINEDITKYVELEQYLHSRNQPREESHVNQLYHGNVNQMLEHLIESAQAIVNKDIPEMTKEDKLVFLDYLDRRGAFLISKSSIRLCEVLGISKFTLYNYLDTIRANRQDSNGISTHTDGE